MAYVIAEPCTDIKDKSCMQQCPVDCIYEGERALYINPDECIECGACEPACPVGAVFYDAELPEEYSDAVDSNASFFLEILPGRKEPLGQPRGARHIGAINADSKSVAERPYKG